MANTATARIAMPIPHIAVSAAYVKNLITALVTAVKMCVDSTFQPIEFGVQVF